MAKSKLDRSTAQQCKRVIHYLNAIYGGRVRRMARDLNLSHSLISRVTNMHQGPGTRLLEALADLEVVNQRWLHHGEGDPLLPPTIGTLPVATVLLPGPPTEHRELWTGQRHPVATQYERETRYWFELSRPTRERRTARFRADDGDLLLVEAGRDYLDRLDVITRNVCVILMAPDVGRCMLGCVSVDDHGKLVAELFDQPTNKREKSPYEKFSRQVRRTSRRTPKKQNKESQQPPSPKLQKSKPHSETLVDELRDLDAIVGVVLHVERHTLLRSEDFHGSS